jgi:hypothetical protein
MCTPSGIVLLFAAACLARCMLHCVAVWLHAVITLLTLHAAVAA